MSMHVSEKPSQCSEYVFTVPDTKMTLSPAARKRGCICVSGAAHPVFSAITFPDDSILTSHISILSTKTGLFGRPLILGSCSSSVPLLFSSLTTFFIASSSFIPRTLSGSDAIAKATLVFLAVSRHQQYSFCLHEYSPLPLIFCHVADTPISISALIPDREI